MGVGRGGRGGTAYFLYLEILYFPIYGLVEKMLFF